MAGTCVSIVPLPTPCQPAARVEQLEGYDSLFHARRLFMYVGPLEQNQKMEWVQLICPCEVDFII